LEGVEELGGRTKLGYNFKMDPKYVKVAMNGPSRMQKSSSNHPKPYIATY